MPVKELILSAAILASAVAQDTKQPPAATNAATIGGVSIMAPKGNPPQTPDEPEGYRLGPGDQVTVHVVDFDEIPNAPYRVDPKGFIQVPTVGRLRAEGLTIDDFSALLRERLKRFLVEPDVTVSITQLRSQPVSILGAVGTPGVRQLEGNETLFEMIQQAGGIRPEAGNRIHIMRTLKHGRIPLPDASDDATGRYSVASVRVKDFMQGSAPADNIALQPEDVISVPTGQLIYVIGAVAKSGGYVLNENESLSGLQILSLAGGLVHGAAPQRAKILRPVPDSAARTEIAVDLRKVLDGKSPDLQLQPNDVLIIPSSGRNSAALRTIEAAIGIGTAATTAMIYRY